MLKYDAVNLVNINIKSKNCTNTSIAGSCGAAKRK